MVVSKRFIKGIGTFFFEFSFEWCALPLIQLLQLLRNGCRQQLGFGGPFGPFRPFSGQCSVFSSPPRLLLPTLVVQPKGTLTSTVAFALVSDSNAFFLSQMVDFIVHHPSFVVRNVTDVGPSHVWFGTSTGIVLFFEGFRVTNWKQGQKIFHDQFLLGKQCFAAQPMQFVTFDFKFDVLQRAATY